MKNKNADATSDSFPERYRLWFFIVLAVGLTACWFGLSLHFIGGFQFWIHTTAAHLHLFQILVCATIVAVSAMRATGTLEFRIGRIILVTILTFGAYALVILGGRFFFSRALIFSAFVGTLGVSIVLVALRYRLSPPRVAIVAASQQELDAYVPFGDFVSDPNLDLTAYDIILLSLAAPVTAEWARALSRAMLNGCKVRHIGEYFEELSGAVSLEHFDLNHLPPNGISSYRLLKRLMDIGLVVFILPVTLPAILLAAAGIILTSGAPVFFVQERVGLGGLPFKMWKLRTMRPEAAGEVLRAAVPGDVRVTRIGRLLRRFRIDELPQLWNVIIGDMSLIGPRPEATPLHLSYLSKLPHYSYRYLVRPGITGWAQVNMPPSASPIEARQKLTYDLYYVKKLSLGLDLKIILRTFWTITSGSGVR